MAFQEGLLLWSALLADFQDFGAPGVCGAPLLWERAASVSTLSKHVHYPAELQLQQTAAAAPEERRSGRVHVPVGPHVGTLGKSDFKASKTPLAFRRRKKK